jgi:hypothetical protein
MIEANKFLRETSATASFAFREYFRPLVAGVRFLKSHTEPSERATPTPDARRAPDDVRALLRARLAQGRRHGRFLLLLSITSSLAALLAVVAALMQTLDMGLALRLASILLCIFAAWMTQRLVRNREEIIELKTLRWLMQSIDAETAACVAKQVEWGEPLRKRPSRKTTNPSGRAEQPR